MPKKITKMSGCFRPGPEIMADYRTRHNKEDRMFPDIKPPFSDVERLLADFSAVQTLGVMYDKLDQYRIKANSMNAQLIGSA